MTRITSIKRLMSATSDFGLSTHVMERQVERTQARLNQGVDVDGNSFAPYKNPSATHDNDRPLQRAARLFEGAHYDVAKTLDGVELRSSIVGEAAKIAAFQNVRRRFLGFSLRDREEIRDELKLMIVEAYRQWRRR